MMNRILFWALIASAPLAAQSAEQKDLPATLPAIQPATPRELPVYAISPADSPAQELVDQPRSPASLAPHPDL